MIKTNYAGLDEKRGFEPLPKGNYEATIEKLFSYDADAKTATFVLRIRDDVEQDGKKRTLLLNLKDSDDERDQKTLNRLLKAVCVDEGTELNNLQEVYDFCEGAEVRIFVTQYESKTDGSLRNGINYIEATRNPALPF